MTSRSQNHDPHRLLREQAVQNPFAIARNTCVFDVANHTNNGDLRLSKRQRPAEGIVVAEKSAGGTRD